MRNLEKCVYSFCAFVLLALIATLCWFEVRYVDGHLLTKESTVEDILSPYEIAYNDCLGETKRYRGYDIRDIEMGVCLTERGFPVRK